MEHLASHGYAVFSIAHTYDAAPVVFPNGDVIELPAEYANGQPQEEESLNLPFEEVTRLAMELGPKISAGKTYGERLEGTLGEIELTRLLNDRVLRRRRSIKVSTMP